ELLRHEDLLDLAAERLRGADAFVVVPDQLLGDRGAALQAPAGAGEVVVGGTEDAGGRDTALVPEVLVLGRHDGVAEHGRDLVVGKDHPVGGTELAHLGLAVAEVDLGRLLHHRRLDIGDRRLRIGVSHTRRSQHHDAADEASDNGQGLFPGPVPPPAALAARLAAVRPAGPAPVAAALAGIRSVPVAAHPVPAQPLAQVVPDVPHAGAEPGHAAAPGRARVAPGGPAAARALPAPPRPPTPRPRTARGARVLAGPGAAPPRPP